MLRSLHVGNYVLIDSLDIDFPEGLVIITGQTGAGKSIILGALGLVLGAKADATLIGPHGETCVVEAEFDVAGDGTLRQLLQEGDLEGSDRMVLRRVVNRSGRSRSFLNDEPVPLTFLQQIAGRLIDIHSQHQTLLLGDAAFRLDLLDHYAGNGDRLTVCRTAWKEWQELRKEWQAVTGRLRELTAERDYNESRFRRLEEAKLRPGELEELDAEQKQLAHAEEIKELLCGVEEAFSPSDDRIPLSQLLKEAGKQLSKASRFIPVLGPLSERLESARLELEDIAGEVSTANARMDVSPQRLEEVEDRMSLLYDLMGRQGVQTVEDLIALREQLSSALFDSAALESRAADLEQQVHAAENAYAAAASALHEARVRATEAFSAAIMASLRFLELERAVFAVDVQESPAGPSGRDTVRFLFSSTGREPVDVAKAASGGELSRIMLSLKAMMARYTAMPTMIFDEIDTGVSGSAADRMGSMIGEMGDDMQVFAITHLPQVAAKGKAHYLVTKTDDVTAIRRLDDEERIQELARMLSGSVVTGAAVENAKALLGL